MLKARTKTGASMIAAAIFAAFFILLPLAIYGFELMRFSIAQLQLRSVCDASALSGAVGVAGARNRNITQAQQDGMTAAFITFKQNMLLGRSLDPARLGGIPSTVHFNDGSRPSNPAPGACDVVYTLMDQNFNRVITGDPAAKLVRCEAIYGYVPPIGGSFGFTNVPVAAFAEGGLPQLDIVLCFDCSGSMDDQTPVTYVQRSWWDTPNDNKNPPRVQYRIVSVNKNNPAGAPVSQASISNISYPPKAGTPFNAIPPQNLDNAKYDAAQFINGNRRPYKWYSQLRCANAGTEIAQPPGNKRADNTRDTSMALTDPAFRGVFTDCVVNLDGRDVFAGYNDGVSGLSFPNVGALVEASRGNLSVDRPTLDAASPNNNLSIGPITPNGSYQSVYYTLAQTQLQPMAAAQTAATGFYQTMNISANCHFGFVAFSDDAGTSADPDSIWSPSPANNKRIDISYPQGGTGTFVLPCVKLDPIPANNNFTTCTAKIGLLRATGKTAIANALREAIAQLDKGGTPVLTRTKARRAVVLFTDGIPNVPGGSLAGDEYNSPASQQTRLEAASAQSKGIQIFCIGLSQNTTLTADMTRILQGISDPTGGQTIVIQNSADLDRAFQTIAKSLVVLR